jgi:deoxyribonuclease V
MKPVFEHPWNLTPKEAIKLQQELRDRVSLTALPGEVHTIAGVDVSLNRFAPDIYAGVIVLSFPDMTIITHSVVKATTPFPYIPGLLSFREIPALIQCFKKLKITPDVVMVDGQGIAHPRRLGIASHLGLLLGIPTIGCAKSRLYGIGTEPQTAGEMVPLRDPKTTEILATMIKVKDRARPIIISPGHLITLDEAVSMTLHCLRGYRLPEPTRQAHLLVNQFRKGEL